MIAKKVFKVSLISIISIILIGVIVLSVFTIGFKVHKFERYYPSSETEILSEDAISQIFEDGVITDAEYSTLYYQTGLTKIGVDSVYEDGGVDYILDFQESYFEEYELTDDFFAPFCNYIGIDSYAEMVPLQDGDIIISSSTQFACWQVGHAALVIDADEGLVLEAVGIGDDSSVGFAEILAGRPTFMVLRPKAKAEVVNGVVEFAKENLVGVPYDPTVGILSHKYNPEIPQTQCAHIIWFAFMQYGIDIDSNGGLIVFPKDISNSSQFDIVQVFGFHPDKLWKE